jgi:hypothetical protein
VTCSTCRRCAGMIEPHSAECRGTLVAGFTSRACHNVALRLAGRGTAVVTCRACRQSRGMGELRSAKGDGAFVTGLARRRCCNVARRLAGRDAAIVTCHASCRSCGMGELRSAEGHGALVAGLAGRACCNMALRPTGRVPAVMARRTRTLRGGVTKSRWAGCRQARSGKTGPEIPRLQRGWYGSGTRLSPGHRGNCRR